MIAAGKLPADIPPDFGYVHRCRAEESTGNGSPSLCPTKKHITHTNSGHEIHKEQPQLVVDAIREVC